MKTNRAHIVGAIAVTLLTGSIATVSAQSPSVAPEASPPVEFSGHIDCGGQVRTDSLDTVGDHQEYRGGAWVTSITQMSDPRLDGIATISRDKDVYRSVTGGAYTLGSGTWRIETDAGAWQGSYDIVGFPDDTFTTVTTPLIGEGAYEGLVAVWESEPYDCGWDVRGVIFPGGPPEPPTAP
jgi:hypothetical protein